MAWAGALPRAALNVGDLVAATARRPAQLDDLLAEFGERIHPIALDVTDAQAARSAIADARCHFGRLEVIVDNAGFANVSPIEIADDEDFRSQFETNFWGLYHVSKAAIPVLREQGGGLVMQISSVGGRVGGSPGIAVEGSIRLDERLLAEEGKWSDLSRSADFSEPYPVELPADMPK